jgi:ferredoxin/flavodoxin---NADP+ reductase
MTEQLRQHRPLRVAVVGSGPAGVYATQALLAADETITVDVFDRLPAPFGLVRYGVAPDHPKIKSISRALHQVLASPRVRFLGNVRFGAGSDAADLTGADLARHYDAAVHARGAPRNRKLGVPGEELPGSAAAAEFVTWYNGDPYGPSEWALHAERVAVIGAGNVALDAARMLITGTDALSRTDVPDDVLAGFGRNAATDVYLVARRGPAYAKFTTPELRELAELPGVDLVVDAADVPDDDESHSRTVRNNLAELRDWAARPPTAAPRRLHFVFWQRPTRILGTGRVEAIELERTALADGRLTGTGEHRVLPVQAVLRAAGYAAEADAGLPFDESSGTVPHRAGRVVDAAGNPVPGVYVAGWLKRGPVGVIGTNKSDATETVRTLLADAAAGELPTAPEPAPEAVDALLTTRSVRVTDWPGWLRLAEYEAERGQAQGRPAAKVADLRTMLRICNPT